MRRGNPWHDAKGRFCSGPAGTSITRADDTEEENNGQFRYVGTFIGKDELAGKCSGIKRKPLEKTIASPHITLDYGPETVNRTLFGERVKVTVIGYGANDENEGVLVRMETNNPILQKQFDALDNPHITLSVSQKGKPVNTRFLDFKPISRPFSFNMIYGGYTG